MLAAAFFILRRALERGVELGASEFLFDKWHLGPLRLLNFALVGALLVVAQSALKPLAIRPLVLLGQSSLQVFCVHLLFCFAGLTLMGNASALSGWKQAALLIATFSAMLLTAKIFAKSEAKQERQPKTIASGPGLQIEPPAQIETTRSSVPPIDEPLTSSAISHIE
jgi:hypothetical protein